jgi:hypothetical protein
MRTLRKRTYADCPFSAAIELAERSVQGLSPIHLALGTASFPIRDARVKACTLQDASDSARRHPALAVEIAPVPPTPLPTFQLLLTVRPWQKGCRLVLHATYEPPRGALGRIGDALVGRHVAGCIADAFLRDTRTAVEHAWRAQSSSWSSRPAS